jgi:hypothetical protein
MTKSRIRRLIHVIHVIHRQKGPDSAWRDSEGRALWRFAMRNGPPAREESSETRPPRKRAVIFGSQATEAREGPSREKREAQADPTFFVRPRGTGGFGQRNRKTGKYQVRLKTARSEPTGVARPRPEPEPPGSLLPWSSTRSGKTPSPHRRGSSDPGQVGAGGDTGSHFVFGADDATARRRPPPSLRYSSPIATLRSSPGRGGGPSAEPDGGGGSVKAHAPLRQRFALPE